MKQPVTRLIIFFFLLFIVDRANASHEKITGWKAGVASVIITPDEPLWMAGFAFRNHPSEGKLVDVWAKALALEDENGKRAVLVSIELSGLRKFMSDSIRNRLQLKYNLSRDQVLLSSTHTHSGPETGSAYLKDEIEKKKVDRYAIKLEDMIVDLVGRALESLQPATLSAENGVSRFQVNRRNNIESKLLIQSQFIGPNDYAVPVISVIDSSGKIMAIAFGYACHNSILGDYKWSGDYAGFAQLELQKLYPGATA
ncbi:MAG: neutral/alkaline non-lysosomal ceramidase N-terminal domain-containing protein, partial [Ginsengibacter sp.]